MRFQELQAGQRFLTGATVVTERDMRAFAEAFDPQPMHLAAGGAAQNPFGHTIASGYHTLALSWRLWIDTGVLGADAFAGLGLDELRWLRPVFAGDRLSVEVEVLESRPSASHPGTGVVRLALSTRNQRKELVLTYRTAALIRGSGG